MTHDKENVLTAVRGETASHPLYRAPLSTHGNGGTLCRAPPGSAHDKEWSRRMVDHALCWLTFPAPAPAWLHAVSRGPAFPPHAGNLVGDGGLPRWLRRSPPAAGPRGSRRSEEKEEDATHATVVGATHGDACYHISPAVAATSSLSFFLSPTWISYRELIDTIAGALRSFIFSSYF
jgi:hypothetical protein